MNTVTWIFGASAVGKKRYIDAAVAAPYKFGLPDGLCPMFYGDGPADMNSLIAAARRAPLIVRWQWDREKALELVARDRRKADQCIRVCKVAPSVQRSRVIQREGEAKWNEWALIREMQDVDALVQRLSAAFSIPVLYIDTTREDYTCEFTA